jgi:hypothetical protein
VIEAGSGLRKEEEGVRSEVLDPEREHEPPEPDPVPAEEPATAPEPDTLPEEPDLNPPDS